MESKPNVPSLIFRLEMVTTLEDNSVCEGKVEIIASFLVKEFFKMVDRTYPCALSNPWSSLFKVIFSALTFFIATRFLFIFTTLSFLFLPSLPFLIYLAI